MQWQLKLECGDNGHMNFAIKDLLISEPFSCMGTLLQNTRLAKIRYHFQELGSKSHFSVYYFSLSFLFPEKYACIH